MECITACPDTALPNTSQDVSTVLKTAAHYYVTDPAERQKLVAELKGVEERVRAGMNAAIEAKQKTAVQGHHPRGSRGARHRSASRPETEFTGIIDKLAAGLQQRPRDLPFARKEDPRRGRLVLHFRFRPLQRLRRMRAGLRRPRRLAHDDRDRRAERRAHHRADFLAAPARHAAEISRALQRQRRRRIRAKPRCAII